MLWFILAVALSSGYECKGSQEGKEYVLPLAVEVQGENYIFYWPGMAGLGIKIGDHVSVAIVNPMTKAFGVVYYKASKDKLEGQWSSGNGKLYKEICKKAEVKLLHPDQPPKPIRFNGVQTVRVE